MAAGITNLAAEDLPCAAAASILSPVEGAASIDGAERSRRGIEGCSIVTEEPPDEMRGSWPATEDKARKPRGGEEGRREMAVVPPLAEAAAAAAVAAATIDCVVITLLGERFA